MKKPMTAKRFCEIDTLAFVMDDETDWPSVVIECLQEIVRSRQDLPKTRAGMQEEAEKQGWDYPKFAAEQGWDFS